MDKLSADWLTEGFIDFEYKKYILLAYLKQIGKKFGRGHLYPSLSDLIFHHSNLEQFNKDKNSMGAKFPKKLSKIDISKLKLSYDQGAKDGVLIQELESIVSFSLPRMTQMIEEGKEIYDFVEGNMEFEPVGIVPIYVDEGYLLLKHDHQRDISIYRYKTSVFEGAHEKYRGLSFKHIANDFIDFSRTFEKVKLELARYHDDLPNPATYSLVTKVAFPEVPTVLPVAKRLLMRHIAMAA